MTTTFEEVKIGDRVYSLRFGWGTIKNISIDIFYIVFDNGKADYYKYNGYLIDQSITEFQDLYWDIPEIIAPEKPKQLVKKTRWYHAQINKSGELYFIYPVSGYNNKEEAKEIANKLIDKILTVQVEYETEE